MKIISIVLGRVSPRMRDGGSIRYIEVCRRWANNGCQLNVILPRREYEEFIKKEISAKYYVLPEDYVIERSDLLHMIYIYIKRALQAIMVKVYGDIDIIYSHSDFLYDVVPSIIFKRRKKAKLAACLFLLLRRPSFGKRYINVRSLFYFLGQQFSLFLLNRYADLVIVLNNADKEYLNSRYFKPRVEVVNMGVDIDYIKNISGSTKYYEGVFVGRFHPQKGVEDLLKIWCLVCKEKPDAKLAVIGNGDKWWRNRISKKIFEMKLSNNIDLLGYKEGADKFSILKSSKVFLFPSYYESWGMVVAEAMACSVPVVAYNLPIFKDIFCGCIRTVSLGDTKAFAEEVLRMLRDEAFCHSISLKAQMGIVHYDWDMVAERDLTLLKELL